MATKSLPEIPVAAQQHSTPGPWWASATREVFNPAGRTVCRAHLDGGRCSQEQAMANARLIAAAPDLYAALEHILDGTLSLPRFAEDEARKALAKARGDLP